MLNHLINLVWLCSNLIEYEYDYDYHTHLIKWAMYGCESMTIISCSFMYVHVFVTFQNLPFSYSFYYICYMGMNVKHVCMGWINIKKHA